MGVFEFRYTGVDLSAPERVRYFYRLEDLDREWVSAGARRVTNYNSLRHGYYRFVVRAGIPGSASGPKPPSRFISDRIFTKRCGSVIFTFCWRRPASGDSSGCACGRSAGASPSCWRSGFGWRARSTIRWRKVLSGISSQLDAVAMTLNGHLDTARQHLDLARKMARHSLTEAQTLGDGFAGIRTRRPRSTRRTLSSREAMDSGIQGSGLCRCRGRNAPPLPEEMEQHLLRIAQEAVANTVKHARASEVRIRLEMENGRLRLSVSDDGQGFEQTDAFSEIGGHFGLLGMRERAERLGGELELHSTPGRAPRWK